MAPAILLLMLACHQAELRQSPEAKTEIIPIRFDTITTVPPSQMIAQLTQLPLQTQPGHPIGEIAKICTEGNRRIYVLDRIANEIEVFDRQGQFLFRIDRGGIGPGKFRAVSDLQVDPTSHGLGVLDALQTKFMAFDSTGALIKEYPLMGVVNVTKFSYVSQGNMIFSRGIPPDIDRLQYSLLLTNRELKIKKRLMHYEKSSSAVEGAYYPFQKLAGQTFYLPAYSPVLYQVDSNATKPIYTFDFGDKWISDEYAYEDIHANDYHWVFQDLPKSPYIYFLNYVLTQDKILLYYSFLGREYLTIYDKRSHQVVSTRLNKDYKAIGFTADNGNTFDDGSYIGYKNDSSHHTTLLITRFK